MDLPFCTTLTNQNICVKFKIAAFEEKIIQKFKLDNEWLFFVKFERKKKRANTICQSLMQKS